MKHLKQKGKRLKENKIVNIQNKIFKGSQKKNGMGKVTLAGEETCHKKRILR